MRRRLVPLMLLLLTAASGFVAVRPPGDAAAVEGHPPPRVPVLSARRAPALLTRVVADSRLRARLDDALASPSFGGGARRSCILVRHGSRTIISRRADERLVPASNLKVLTGLAVLTRLGPEETLTTEVRVERPIGAAGEVAGPLWLVGGGDPLLATADYAASLPNQPQLFTPLEKLADAVVEAGVREVRGGVVGDESRYDEQRYVPSWRQVYITDSESGPASALAVNDGFVQFTPKRVAAAEPDLHAAGVFTALLRARGVVVSGGPGEGQAPLGAPVVAEVASRPVRQLVGQMLRESDNLTAELLVKELGRRFAGAGTTTAGVGVMRQTLASASLPVDHLAAVDGSGLDRSDRASCTLLMAALDAGAAGHLAAGFPVAGRDGTLAKRFVGNPAAGRLRAKTGSLDGVAALTGYVDSTGTGPPVAFAFLINQLPPGVAVGRAVQEQLGALLAGYPEAPAPDLLAP